MSATIIPFPTGDSVAAKDSREPLSRRRRFAILSRDKFTCQYCGAKAPDVELQVDHVLAVANGGTDDDDNLATACFDCNIGKRADLLPISFHFAQTEHGLPSQWLDMVGSVIADEVYLPEAKIASIRRFLLAMGLERTVAAADIARQKFGPTARGFRYFHGICSRWIKVWKSEPATNYPQDSEKRPQRSPAK